MDYKVYIISNSRNNLKYIGITVQSLKKRFSQHCGDSSYSKALLKAITEIGKDKFNITLLKSCSTEQEMQELEILYIKEYNTLWPNGYNLTTGGTHTTFSNAIKEKMSHLGIERWQNPSFREINLPQIKSEGLKRRKKVVGVNINTGKIKRLSYISESKKIKSISSCLNNKCNYIKNYTWFYDKGETDEQIISRAKERLGTDFGKYSKGRNSWNKSDYDLRIKAMREGTKHRQKSIISVHTQTGIATVYAGVHEMVRLSSKAISSVYACLNGKAKTGQKYCWFYYDPILGEKYYIHKAENLIGGFKKSFTVPLVGIFSGKEYAFDNVQKASEFTKLKVKTIRRHLRADRGYAGFIKGWKFRYLNNFEQDLG
jgi:hypothetical protein